jgi:hypothetical protein
MHSKKVSTQTFAFFNVMPNSSVKASLKSLLFTDSLLWAASPALPRYILYLVIGDSLFTSSAIWNLAIEKLSVVEHHASEAHSYPEKFPLVGKVSLVWPDDLSATWYESPFYINNQRQIMVRVEFSRQANERTTQTEIFGLSIN